MLRKGRRPLLASARTTPALAQGYQTKSKDFTTVVSVMLASMDNVVNVPGQGYRLQKRKG